MATESITKILCDFAELLRTLSDSFSLLQRGSKMHASRVGFISNASGERFALPGPSRAENQWTVPVSAFDVQDIVGHLLVKLKPSDSASGFQLARGSDGQPILSVTVQCCISRDNEIRLWGGLGALADNDGLVRVVFGDRALKESYEDVPCISVSDISTPRSVMSNGRSRSRSRG